MIGAIKRADGWEDSVLLFEIGLHNIVSLYSELFFSKNNLLILDITKLAIRKNYTYVFFSDKLILIKCAFSMGRAISNGG